MYFCAVDHFLLRLRSWEQFVQSAVKTLFSGRQKQSIKTLKAYTNDIDLTLTKAEPYPYKDSQSVYLFLVDTSDPRRIAEIEEIKKHIKFILDQAKPYESYGLYSFNSDINQEASIGSSKPTINNKLNTLKATGRTTELYRSTIQAMRKLNSINADRKTLIIH